MVHVQQGLDAWKVMHAQQRLDARYLSLILFCTPLSCSLQAPMEKFLNLKPHVNLLPWQPERFCMPLLYVADESGCRSSICLVW